MASGPNLSSAAALAPPAAGVQAKLGAATSRGVLSMASAVAAAGFPARYAATLAAEAAGKDAGGCKSLSRLGGASAAAGNGSAAFRSGQLLSATDLELALHGGGVALDVGGDPGGRGGSLLAVADAMNGGSGGAGRGLAGAAASSDGLEWETYGRVRLG
jgi:hypothetical protein